MRQRVGVKGSACLGPFMLVFFRAAVSVHPFSPVGRRPDHASDEP